MPFNAHPQQQDSTARYRTLPHRYRYNVHFNVLDLCTVLVEALSK